MKIKRIAFILSALLCLCCFSFPINAESAASAVVIEADSGIAIYEKKADTRRPMASTTKIMTALIALETKSPDSIFTVSGSAASVDGSQLGLNAGDKISLRDLLYMLMLKSANDAAEVIAENIGGSVEKFANLMNLRAEKMGLKDTHFINPHGLPNDEHFTTARELALITRIALQNSFFAELVSTKRAKLTYRKLVLENSNRLLSAYPYTTGVKTGFTKKAGRCLVSSARKDGVTLICVTLNDGNDWNDHQELLNTCFTRVSCNELYSVGRFRICVPVLNGTEDAVFTNTEAIYGVTVDGTALEYDLTSHVPQLLYAPVVEKTGTVWLCRNGQMLRSVPLCLERSAEPLQRSVGFFEKLKINFIRLLDKM